MGSVRVRITVLATLVFAIAFTAAAFLLVNSVRGSLEDAVRADNKMFLSTVASQVAAGAPAHDVLAPNSSAGFQIIDDGVVVGGSGGLAYQPPIVGLSTEKSVSAGAVALPGPGQDAIVGIQSVDTPAGKKFTVAVASPLDGVRRSVDTVVRDLKIGVPVLILVV